MLVVGAGETGALSEIPSQTLISHITIACLARQWAATLAPCRIGKC
jgi:hypothetical protein